ncbi:response regulator [bacterium]|nr:response regulator [bacterium]
MAERSLALKIWLVEDEPADHALVRMSLDELGLPWSLEITSDGQEALQHIQSQQVALPHLVLLDLSLPGYSGLEVLRHLRAEERWRTVPVVVLSTSNRQSDVSECYRAGANTFVRKPIGYQGLLGDLRILHEYWARLACLDSSLGEAAS